jgi:cytidine deaminase
LVACRKIPGLCEPIVQRILETLEQFGLKGRWRIPEDARKMLEHQLDIGTHTLMQKLCIVAQTFAVPVISAFHVGAAVLGTSGDVFLGLNVEICSGSYSNNLCGLRQTIHAEQAAILCMFSQGEPGAEKLYCTHVPCGMCRQFLAELPNHEALNIWCPQIKDGITLAKLLPHSFGPADLGVSAGLLSRGDRNPIYLGSASEAREVDLALAMVAELAAQRSWAPYTKSYAGCALRLANGDHVHGSCIESAAFNPTMTPLQMALVTLFARGGGVHDIKDACLAEDSSALVSYKDADGSLLNAIAPGVSLWLLPLERRDDHVFSSGF